VCIDVKAAAHPYDPTRPHSIQLKICWVYVAGCCQSAINGEIFIFDRQIHSYHAGAVIEKIFGGVMPSKSSHRRRRVASAEGVKIKAPSDVECWGAVSHLLLTKVSGDS